LETWQTTAVTRRITRCASISRA